MHLDSFRQWTPRAVAFKPDLHRLFCQHGADFYSNDGKMAHRIGIGWPRGTQQHTILALAEDEPHNKRVLLRITVGPKHGLVRAGGPFFVPKTGNAADIRDRVDCYLPYSRPIPEGLDAAAEKAFKHRLSKLKTTPSSPSPAPTPVACDTAEPPPRVRAEVSRIVRDTTAARELKSHCGHQCQLCGLVLLLGDQPYSEAHHLQPLGGEHNGVDKQWNMMVVCPNCHAKLDFGAVRLAADPGPAHLNCLA